MSDRQRWEVREVLPYAAVTVHHADGTTNLVDPEHKEGWIIWDRERNRPSSGVRLSTVRCAVRLAGDYNDQMPWTSDAERDRVCGVPTCAASGCTEDAADHGPYCSVRHRALAQEVHGG